MIDQHKAQWFRFSGHQMEDEFGYGTKSEAHEYAIALGHPKCAVAMGEHVELATGVGFVIAEALECLTHVEITRGAFAASEWRRFRRIP